MGNFLIFAFYSFISISATLGIWVIASEVTKIKDLLTKNKHNER